MGMEPGLADDPACRELSVMHERMFAAHLGTREDMDDRFRELFMSEGKLEEILGGEADSKALIACRRTEAAGAVDRNAAILADCERELAEQVTELEMKGQLERQLNGELSAAEQQEARARSGPVAAATESEELLAALGEVEKRERVLRALERRLLSVDDMRQEGERALAALVKEHEELNAMARKYYHEKDASMQWHDEQLQRLRAELAAAEAERDEAARRLREAGDARAEQDAYTQQLKDVHAALRGDLEHSLAAKQAAEAQLRTHAAQIDSGDLSWLVMKLEEVMMLLKAAVINLGTDHGFIGEVNERAADVAEVELRGVESFCDAFNYIRTYVNERQGPQPANGRWAPPDGQAWQPAPYDAVEPLLSALKQMVTCFDMMVDAGKRDIPYSREIILNSCALLDLVHETSAKYAEIERARDAEEARQQAEKEELQRLRDAKKYAPRPNRDPYSRRAASASAVTAASAARIRSGSGRSGVSAAVSVGHPRDAAPEPAPAPPALAPPPALPAAEAPPAALAAAAPPAAAAAAEPQPQPVAAAGGGAAEADAEGDAPPPAPPPPQPAVL